jgi:WhiB family redox-sensing transcriptional regulator
MTASHYAPDTLEPAGQWLKQGACRDEADAMFPGTIPADIEYAKAICRTCAVIQACGQWALATREPDGVLGGMSETERRNLLRQAARRNLTPDQVKAQAEQARRPVEPRTLRTIFNNNTKPLPGGHLAWTGPRKISYLGQTYTPKQLCYIVDRGHHPDGQITSDCGITDCHLPRHLIDVGERTRHTAAVKAHA